MEFLDDTGDGSVKFSGEGVSEEHSGKLASVCLCVAEGGECALVYGGKVY